MGTSLAGDKEERSVDVAKARPRFGPGLVDTGMMAKIS